MEAIELVLQPALDGCIRSIRGCDSILPIIPLYNWIVRPTRAVTMLYIRRIAGSCLPEIEVHDVRLVTVIALKSNNDAQHNIRACLSPIEQGLHSKHTPHKLHLASSLPSTHTHLPTDVQKVPSHSKHTSLLSGITRHLLHTLNAHARQTTCKPYRTHMPHLPTHLPHYTTSPHPTPATLKSPKGTVIVCINTFIAPTLLLSPSYPPSP
jgi:hypothetical protein